MGLHMDKIKIQRDIKKARARIEDLNDEIQRLEQKKKRLTAEYDRRTKQQYGMEEYFGAKRSAGQILLAGIQGKAANRILQEHQEMYSISKCNSFVAELEAIKGYILTNVGRINESIMEVQANIRRLESDITMYRRDLNKTD